MIISQTGRLLLEIIVALFWF